MPQKKTKEVDNNNNSHVKRPLSHKGFYTLLLTALLGMFLFVSYYASQQIQVYQSKATSCNPIGSTCTGSGAQCCSNTCINGKCAASGGGGCRPAGAVCTGSGAQCCSGVCNANGTCGAGGGGATPTPSCRRAGETCTGAGNRCCSGTCTNGKCQSGGGGGGCTSKTTTQTCNNTPGCKWFNICSKCDSSSKGTIEVCGGPTPTLTPTPTPTLTPTPTPAACINYTDPASCASAGCGWNSELGCCGGEPPCVSGGGGGTGTPTPPVGTGTPNPTPTGGGGGGGTATFNITVSLQGITKSPVSGSNLDFNVTLVGGPNNVEIPTTANLTENGSGLWSGNVSFTNVKGGGGYKLLVKGPKHLQKKVCDATPTETSPGTYHCGDGNITVSTSGVNILDFSGIKLMVGDLPAQDGIVDSYDIALVRNSLCTTDNPNACHNLIADLNFDGIVDTQDYSLLISSLSVKYDEQ